MNGTTKKKQRPNLIEFEGKTTKEIMAILRGDDIRIKTDLKDWTGSPPFHLDKNFDKKKEK